MSKFAVLASRFPVKSENRALDLELELTLPFAVLFPSVQVTEVQNWMMSATSYIQI